MYVLIEFAKNFVYVHYGFVIFFLLFVCQIMLYSFQVFFSKSNHFWLFQGVEEAVEEAGEGAADVVGVSDQMVLCRLLPEC